MNKKFNLSDLLQHVGTVAAMAINIYTIFYDMKKIVGPIDKILLGAQITLYIVLFFILKLNNHISSNYELFIWVVFTFIIIISDYIKKNISDKKNKKDDKDKKDDKEDNSDTKNNDSNNNLNFYNGYKYINSDNDMGSLVKGQFEYSNFE